MEADRVVGHHDRCGAHPGTRPQLWDMALSSTNNRLMAGPLCALTMTLDFVQATRITRRLVHSSDVVQRWGIERVCGLQGCLSGASGDLRHGRGYDAISYRPDMRKNLYLKKQYWTYNGCSTRAEMRLTSTRRSSHDDLLLIYELPHGPLALKEDHGYDVNVVKMYASTPFFCYSDPKT